MEYLIGVEYSSVLANEQYFSKDRLTTLFDFSGVIYPHAIHWYSYYGIMIELGQPCGHLERQFLDQ